MVIFFSLLIERHDSYISKRTLIKLSKTRFSPITPLKKMSIFIPKRARRRERAAPARRSPFTAATHISPLTPPSSSSSFFRPPVIREREREPTCRRPLAAAARISLQHTPPSSLLLLLPLPSFCRFPPLLV